MQTIGETEILIDATVAGKVRLQNVSRLTVLRPAHRPASNRAPVCTPVCLVPPEMPRFRVA